MSYRPTIGGRLWKKTSGVDRSQAGSFWWGSDPVKEISQTCGLNVIMRRRATSNRSVVTAAKLVYSSWKFRQPGERHGKAIYRYRPAPEPVHMLYTAGERPDVPDGVETRGPAAFCEEAAARRRSSGGDHVEHAAVSRRGGPAGGARGGGKHQPVSRHQAIGEENRSQRRAVAVVVSVEGIVAGGADEG